MARKHGRGDKEETELKLIEGVDYSKEKLEDGLISYDCLWCFTSFLSLTGLRGLAAHFKRAGHARLQRRSEAAKLPKAAR